MYMYLFLLDGRRYPSFFLHILNLSDENNNFGYTDTGIQRQESKERYKCPLCIRFNRCTYENTNVTIRIVTKAIHNGRYIETYNYTNKLSLQFRM